jgi:hypothetical protein
MILYSKFLKVCNPNYELGPSICVHVKILCSYIGVNGRLHAHMFMYPHLNNKVLSLSSMDLPNLPFLWNLIPLLDEGSLCITYHILHVLLHRLSDQVVTGMKKLTHSKV